MFSGMVTFGVSGVLRPMMPIFTPATSTMRSRRAQAGVSPEDFSCRLAERNGKEAMAAFFFSAPNGSSVGLRGMASGPTGPKSNSWLPTAAAAYPIRLYAFTTGSPSKKFESSVPWKRSPESTSTTRPGFAARNACT
jgi:hypothetical protein